MARPLGWSWTAWTTPEQLSIFLAPRANVDLERGGAFELFFNEDAGTEERGTRGGVILELENEHTLAFSLTPPAGIGLHGVETTVRLQLRSLGPFRSRVQVTHSGFHDGVRYERLMAFYKSFWVRAISRFASYAAGSPAPAWPSVDELWPETPPPSALTVEN